MIYSIGVDIGVDEFHAAVIDESCKPVASKHFPCEESGFASFMAWVDGLVGPVHELCLCIEACGVLHLNLVFWLREHRPEVSVYVVNALAAKRYGGAKLRRNHTDPADAFHLGVMVARSRDELHVFTVEPAHRQVQRLVLERGQIARDIVRQTNRLHAALVVNFPEYSRVMRKVDQALSLELLSRFPTAQSVAKAGIKRLSQIRPNAKGCHALGEKRAQLLWELAQTSVGCGQSKADAGVVVRLVEILKSQHEQMSVLEKEIERACAHTAEGQLPKQVEALRAVPAIGPVTAVGISARCGLISHFRSADSFSAFIGTCPGRYQSGKSTDTAMLTPYGPVKLRAQLYLGVRNAKRTCPAIAFLYDLFRQRGLKHRQALCACLNHVVHWCWGVVTTGSRFDLKKVYGNLLRHHEKDFRQFCLRKGIQIDCLLAEHKPAQEAA